MNSFPGLFNYWIVIFLMMAGFYVVISQGNLVKKMIGLSIFQTSVFILFISMANIDGAAPPILANGITLYSNPLPHVLILTAIVVAVSTTAVGLSLIIRIKESYGTVEEDKLETLDHQADDAEAAPTQEVKREPE
jgi:multicomponent Na+:H+ antiporter subunit C